VIVVDTFEALTALSGWIKTEFLPRLDAETLVVLAGRSAPDATWAAEPGWRDMLRVISLRNLPPEDARAFLDVAKVPASLHDAVLHTTYGHPLALSLTVDVLSQRDATGADDAAAIFEKAPDMVRGLLARFVEAVPSERHKSALEVCAHSRFTTEDLLRAALPGDDAHALFGWLRELSFIDESQYGVFPHDIVRDMLETDLRWRDQERYAALHRRVRSHVIAQIRASSGFEQQRRIYDLVFMHRRNPIAGRFWDWSSLGQAYPDELHPVDRAFVLEATARFQGPEQADLAQYWIDRQPEAFVVFRSRANEPVGFACLLDLTAATDADRAGDPGARAMWEYVQRCGPPRPGEKVSAGRFFMDAVEYQRQPSLSQNAISAWHLRQIFRASASAWDLIGVYEDAAHWEPFFAYMDFHRARDAEYEVGGKHYAVFAHDWRRLDREHWLELMGERELGAEPAPPTGPAPELVLSQSDFAEAVRAVLRHVNRPDKLKHSPLVQSRLVAGADDPPAALRALVCDAADTLREDPRDERFYRAVDRTYIRPAPTQERAAEVLDLPLSTYRRHLRRGVERIVEQLWHRELYD
jgi:hypothetical protein